jgi:hypothetical protein
LPAVARAVIKGGAGGGQDFIVSHRIFISIKRSEKPMTAVMHLISVIAFICLCVLLLLAISGCRSNSPEWRGIDSGYDSQ